MGRRCGLAALAFASLGCGGLGLHGSHARVSMSDDLLHVELWCDPAEMVLYLHSYDVDLSACLPAGHTSAAARIELVAGGQPRSLAETAPGFGACAARTLQLELVLHEMWGGSPKKQPLPAKARCEGVFATGPETWAAVEQVSPPKNAVDGFMEWVDGILMPEGHL